MITDRPATWLIEPPDAPDVQVHDAAGYAHQVNPRDVIAYDGNYWQAYLEYADGPLDRPINAHRVALAGKYCRRVLDIGIGCGRFLEAWLDQGDDGPYARSAAGTDVNHVAEGWLRSHGLWHDAEAHGLAGFDGITLWDVLEHLTDPADFLSRVQPGQYVILTLPIARDFRTLEAWKHYKPREHLHHWTHDGLVRWFTAIGFRCDQSDDTEARLGRVDVRSYVFRKLYAGETPPRPGRSVLVTNGLGDFLAVESHWTVQERSQIETIYYATPSEPWIRDCIAAMPWAHGRPLHHVTLWDVWDAENHINAAGRPPKCFVCAAEVADYVRVPPGVEDLSIAEQFARFTEQLVGGEAPAQFGSSLEFPDAQGILPNGPYVLIHPEADDAEPGRNFDAADWSAVGAYCAAPRRYAVVVGAAGGPPLPQLNWLIDVRGLTSPVRSITLLQHADAFIGIDSWLSVLAAQRFRWPNLAIKCRRDEPGGGIAWRHIYWRPLAPYLGPLAELPWLGPSIPEILRRRATA